MTKAFLYAKYKADPDALTVLEAMESFCSDLSRGKFGNALSAIDKELLQYEQQLQQEFELAHVNELEYRCSLAGIGRQAGLRIQCR